MAMTIVKVPYSIGDEVWALQVKRLNGTWVSYVEEFTRCIDVIAIELRTDASTDIVYYDNSGKIQGKIFSTKKAAEAYVKERNKNE